LFVLLGPFLCELSRLRTLQMDSYGAAWWVRGWHSWKW
jgi:hypothetical protein